MACILKAKSQSPEILYPHVFQMLEEMLGDETNWVANAANAASTLGFLIENLNWVGFYLKSEKEDELLLGPFWGKPAVARIAVGKGVCGDSAHMAKTILVPDVHQYPGHIACDLYSNSEIVVPLIKNGDVIGVLDIDSPELERFNEQDAVELEKVAKWLVERIAFPYHKDK